MSALFYISTIKIVGVLAILIGIGMRYYVGKQRFKRRSIGGLQQFKTYEGALATTFFERILKFIGLILLLAGLFFCFVDWFNSRPVNNSQQPLIKNVES